MKINWGTGIVIAFVLFISFILFFIIKATTQKQYAYDLVEENYYKTEIKYQDEIDQLKNTTLLTKGIEIKIETAQIKIIFPEELVNNYSKGTISFYKPDAKSLDFELPITFEKDTFEINRIKIVDGNWNVKIKFNNNSKDYLFKKSIKL